MSWGSLGKGRLSVVLALGTTQTVTWASTYYLPAVLAVPIARALDIPNAWVFAAFSGALIVMASVAPFVGRQIDQRGGRIVLSLSHIVIAAGLALLAVAQGTQSMLIAWLVLGIGMAMGMYDAAFAALAGFYGMEARGPITGITLLGGFASTIGWPIHAVLEQAYGWRTACLVWAAVHVLICLPMSLATLPRPGTTHAPQSTAKATSSDDEPAAADASTKRTMLLVALLFSSAWFVTGAMATHLPRLLQEFGATATGAIAAAALVGPAQVAARVAEFSLLGNLHPLVSTRIATALHPIGAAALMLLGGPGAAAFAILHGAGNGMLTIARGTLPLALFGASGYGFRQGLISAPARMTQATSPFLFALVLDVSPLWAITLSTALMLLSLTILLVLGGQPRPDKAG
jgi:predicted MFS family arabinose efflux permease